MTRDINALYSGDMTRLISESDDFGWINVDAAELAKKDGSAVVVRVRAGLPDCGSSTIHVMRYSRGKINPETQSTTLPVSLLETIAEAYKK